jgi:hypothetical protein
MDARMAAFAIRHGRVRLNVDTVLDVLDVYCENCKRFYEEVADVQCEAATSNEHLIGGPTGTRKKRVHDHDCVVYGCELSPAEAAALRAAAANPAPRSPVDINPVRWKRAL